MCTVTCIDESETYLNSIEKFDIEKSKNELYCLRYMENIRNYYDDESAKLIKYAKYSYVSEKRAYMSTIIT